MAKAAIQSSFSFIESSRRFIPFAVRLIVIAIIVAIPLRIIHYGFIPPSDALRHAAKAISGRPWSEILVLNGTYVIDHEFGWQLFLRELYLWTHCAAGTLVAISIVLLFVLPAIAPVSWLKRPEAWLIALIAAALASDLIMRLTLGRPFLLTIAGLLTILSYWKTHDATTPNWRTALWLMGVIAICIFVHGVWYLWALPVAAFFLAGQFRWGFVLGAAWLVGSILAASLTGHPFEAYYQAVEMALRPFALRPPETTLAGELQPASGEIYGLIIFGALWGLRQLTKMNARPFARDPVFWLACLCWVLSFKVYRFSEDWGWPAFVVLIAFDVQLFLETRLAANSFKRIGLVCGAALTIFLVFTNDAGSRWTQNSKWTWLEQDNPALRGWLPDNGGIFYSADMTLFYQTFYKNPNADWRYILGFEPTLMPDADFKIYCDILWYSEDPESYQPWIQKMTPADRLVFRGSEFGTPDIPQLEWGEYGRGANAIWIGRLPRGKISPREQH